MRIERLELTAFGPFTDAGLDFSAGSPGGLHLVLGANEAGKSSALRGLLGFLYGIPERSADNFLGHKELRVAALLRTAAGASLAATRRKGRKNTLLGPDGQPLDESLLRAELAGLPQPVFEALFGLDHARLRQGGQELAEAHGGLGQSLFAAAAGLARLRAADARLAEEADTLFKSRGQVQRINAALADHKRLNAEAAALAAPPAEHERLSRELTQAETARDALAAEHDARARELAELTRVRAALDPLDRRALILEELVRLGDAPLLPPDFRERRFAAMAGLEQARGRMEAAAQARDRARAGLDGLPEPGPWLEHARRIAALQEDLGAHRKAHKDRAGLEREAATLRGRAEEILSRLAPGRTLDRAPELFLPEAEQQGISALVAERRSLGERLDRANSEASRLARDLAAADAELAALPAPPAPPGAADLAAALEAAQEQGGLDQRLDQERAALAASRSRAATGLSRLGACWTGGLDAAVALPVPPDEAVARCEREFDALAADLRDLDRRAADADRELNQARADRAGLEAAGGVPSEAALTAARQRRDAGWTLVRARLEEHPDPRAEAAFLADAAPAPSLPAAFEAAQSAADQAADRLRLQADRAARAASLDAAALRLEEETRALATRRAGLEERSAALQAEWAALWRAAGIAPLPPRDMRSWLAEHRNLCILVRDLRTQAATLEALEATGTRLAAGLAQTLQALGEQRPTAPGLDPAIRRGAAVLSRLADLAARRRDLEARRADLARRAAEASDEADAARKGLTAWSGRWASAVAPLGLPGDAAPEAAAALLSGLAGLARTLHDMSGAERRMAGIDRDAREFAEKVGRLVEELAPDMADMARTAPAEAAEALADRLDAAKERSLKRQALQARLHEAQEEFSAAQADARGHQEVLDLLCADARCPDPAGLDAAERASDRRARLENDLRLLTEQLLPLAAGQPLDAFAAAALARDRAALDRDIAALEAALSGLAARRDAANQQVGALREQFSRMDGSARAADLAQEAQAVLDALAPDVERYAALRLARAILATQIERFRQERQGPVLAEASRAFAALTLGRYAGLDLGYDDKDQPLILPMRPGPDGKNSPVALAALSDGTADQLYLALRLAYLHHYLGTNPPQPVILDDVLVNFDNERAAAALGELARLAGRTQVVLFTHHRHLADLAADTLPADALFIQNL
ncbi:MAG: AAA family ATPase [Thermodesulfobacteriota bacterium]